MRYVLGLLCSISLMVVASPAGAQNGDYSAYYTYTVTYNSDGSATVIPTAELTGIDEDLDDWAVGTYHPLCNVNAKIQLTGDANWVHVEGRALGQLIDAVRTGQPVQVPANGSTVQVQFAVEADVSCYKPPNPIYYMYPQSAALSSWTGFDMDSWWLMGFAPPQTNPPSSTQYCPSPDSCPVEPGLASVLNFVDFADFSNLDLRILTATYFIKTLNGGGYATYTLTCPNNTKSTCGLSTYYGPHTTNWVEQFELYEILFGVCVPPSIDVGFDGPPFAPLPCT
jgi:hypothetical protein